MRVRAVVFDLDGTLIDGYEAIEDALTYAMTWMELEPPTREEVRSMVGHGLEKLLEQAVGAERAHEGVHLFRERFPHVAVSKSHLLPGVTEVLGGLRSSGYRLSLASNKPPEFSRKILEAKGVSENFEAIAGPDEAHPAKPHPAMLRELLGILGVRQEETVCVGDMEVDVEFARAGGCRSIVLPTGSRTREFLSGVGADLMIDTLADLPDALEKLG
jgi:phosphoglycolate phosphatase